MLNQIVVENYLEPILFTVIVTVAIIVTIMYKKYEFDTFIVTFTSTIRVKQ